MDSGVCDPPAPCIDPAISEYLLRIVHDPARYGVPELHFRFWNHGDAAAKDYYVSSFERDPERKKWLEDGYFAPDYDFEALAQLAEGTLGYAYHHHIRRNGLNHKLLLDYRLLQEHRELTGQLDGMPAAVRYATIRGFQTHDILHPLTGYDTSPLGEIALQAFNLAQMGLPYAAFWMSIVTTQSAFLRPQFTVPLMDAITRGWQHGRRSRNVTYERWEERFAEPLDDIRREFALA